MALDQRLVEEARRIHGWNISFSEELMVFDGEIIHYNDWLFNYSEDFEARLGMIDLVDKRSYGLVLVSSVGREYQTIAEVQPGRYENCLGEVLEAVILHLGLVGERVGVEIELPQRMKKEVSERHITLLSGYRERYSCFRDFPGPVQIYSEGEQGELRRVFEGFKISGERRN